MTIKVLVNTIGQHIVADTKQVENKETKEIVGYWLKNPRIVNYSRNKEGEISVAFVPYCLVSDEQEFSVRSTDIVAILEPRDDVVESYSAVSNPEPVGADLPTVTTEEISNETEPAVAEVG